MIEQLQQNNLFDKRISFSLDATIFSLDIQYVKEVIQLSSITPIPIALKSVMGVINLRGEVITVFDPKRILFTDSDFNAAENKSNHNTRIIILNLKNNEPFAICVDAVHDVICISDCLKQVQYKDKSLRSFSLVNDVLEFENNMILNLEVEKLYSALAEQSELAS